LFSISGKSAFDILSSLRYWHPPWFIDFLIRQSDKMHRASITDFLMPLALGNFMPQVWQRLCAVIDERSTAT
jgi:hypothetical protein